MNPRYLNLNNMPTDALKGMRDFVRLHMGPELSQHMMLVGASLLEVLDAELSARRRGTEANRDRVRLARIMRALATDCDNELEDLTMSLDSAREGRNRGEDITQERILELQEGCDETRKDALLVCQLADDLERE